ncbi:MAG: hypothetical protein AB7T22_17380 [Calditrichaceae bacterium]|jgi:hypothetical protein
MKNKINNNSKVNGVSGGTNYDSKVSNLGNEANMKSDEVEVLLPESTNFNFSSPCLLPEIENGENILNHYCGI